MQEQRKHPRIPIDADVAVSDVNSGKMLGRLVNISAGGMMLFVDNPVAVHSVFQVGLHLPDSDSAGISINLGIENLWCSVSDGARGFWAGFLVIDISPDDLQHLVEYTAG